MLFFFVPVLFSSWRNIVRFNCEEWQVCDNARRPVGLDYPLWREDSLIISWMPSPAGDGIDCLITPARFDGSRTAVTYLEKVSRVNHKFPFRFHPASFILGKFIYENKDAGLLTISWKAFILRNFFK